MFSTSYGFSYPYHLDMMLIGGPQTPSLTTPAAPNVTNAGNGQISVSENSNNSNAVSYEIDVYAANGTTFVESTTGTTSGILSANNLSGLTPNTTYQVSVTAIGDGTNYLNSAASSQTSITLALGATSILISLNSPSLQFQHLGSTQIVATLTGANGQVTFYYNNKKIFHCINVLSSGLSAVCNWKPSIHGQVNLSAALIPTSSNYATSYSPNYPVYVGTRILARNT